MTGRLHRRNFLRNSGTALAAGWTIQASQAAQASPADRLRVAVMGVRGRGRSLVSSFADMSDAAVTHLCEVDPSVVPAALEAVVQKGGKAPRVVTDVRRVLDDPAVDALVIATPDHWHALATVWACQAGKHVYVEKPASHNVWEGRKMVEAARKYGRVVQLGTQSRSAPGYLEMIACLRSGKIGKVHMAKAWNSQLRRDLPPKPDGKVPEGVDYDLWQGPAADRPFNPNRFHSAWHWQWDYGTGDMGNDGIHDLDIARWGLDVRSPRSVAGVGTKLFFQDEQQVPDTQIITFTFPESQAILVYEQRIWSPYVQEGYENGAAFYGTEGYILSGRSGWKLVLRGNKPEPTPSRPFSDRPHFQDFLDCIRTPGQRPHADIEEGHLSSTLAHLGNIVARTGRTLTWNAESETITGDPEAAALLRRSYRKPFVIPDQI